MAESSFNTTWQNLSIDGRIVVALERISEAYRVLLWNEGKTLGLSPIQTQVLIFILFHSQNLATISYLAKEFNMTKATISESIKVLISKKLLEKYTNPNDSRSYTLVLTEKGKSVAIKTASFATPIAEPVATLTDTQKAILMNSLLKIILDLNTKGILEIQRMCFNCMHYKLDNGVHSCKIYNTTIQASEIRIDCPEHFLVK